MKKIVTAVVLSAVLAVFSYGKDVSINMKLSVDGMEGAVQQQQSKKAHPKKAGKAPYKVLKAVMDESSIQLSDGRVIPVTYGKAMFPYPKIEILEPVGAKVILSQDGEEDYRGEIPLLWKDAEIDAYVKMMVYETGGNAWSVKFKAKKMAEITIGSRDAEAAAIAPAGISSKHFTIEKQVYAAGEGFSVKFHDMPGNNFDWLSIVPAGSDATEWGTWQYTNGAKEGMFPIPGQEPGKYEIRAYYNHPAGGYTIQDSISFTVK